MTPETRVKHALHALAASHQPDEDGAYDRFRRRHARRVRLEAAGGGLLVLVLLALVAVGPRLPLVGEGTTGGLRTSQRPLTVEGTAYQWGWRFHCRGAGVRVASRPGVAPELVVPAGEPVRFTLTSADVVHSFHLPGELFERAAVPGETVTFEPRFDRVGAHPGRCAIYCGLQHTEMPFTVQVLDRDAFSRWLRAASASGGPWRHSYPRRAWCWRNQAAALASMSALFAGLLNRWPSPS
jgi:cytochrome c oxidase subunit 2